MPDVNFWVCTSDYENVCFSPCVSLGDINILLYVSTPTSNKYVCVDMCTFVLILLSVVLFMAFVFFSVVASVFFFNYFRMWYFLHKNLLLTYLYYL